MDVHAGLEHGPEHMIEWVNPVPSTGDELAKPSTIQTPFHDIIVEDHTLWDEQSVTRAPPEYSSLSLTSMLRSEKQGNAVYTLETNEHTSTVHVEEDDSATSTPAPSSTQEQSKSSAVLPSSNETLATSDLPTQQTPATSPLVPNTSTAASTTRAATRITSKYGSPTNSGWSTLVNVQTGDTSTPGNFLVTSTSPQDGNGGWCKLQHSLLFTI